MVSAIISAVVAVVSIAATATTAGVKAAKAKKAAAATLWDNATASQKNIWMNDMMQEAFSGKYRYNYEAYIDGYVKELMLRADGNYATTSTSVFWTENRGFYQQYLVREKDYLENIDAIIIEQNKRVSLLVAFVLAIIMLTVVMVIIKTKK